MFSPTTNKTSLRSVAAKLLKETYGFSVTNIVLSRLEHLYKRPGQKFIESEATFVNQTINNMQASNVIVPLKQDDFYFEVDIQVPSLIQKICTFLLIHINTKGLFRISGNQKRITLLKAQLLNGLELSNENPHDVSDILKLLLRQLSVHLIPKCLNHLIHQVLQGETCNKLFAFQSCCLLLPTFHLYTLMYILRFLKKVAANEYQNKMSSSSLATILAPNIFELEKIALKDSRSLMLKQEQFLQYLIDYSDNIGTIPPPYYQYFNLKGKLIDKEQWFSMTQTNNLTHHQLRKKIENLPEKSFFDRRIASMRKKKVKSTPSDGKGSRKSKKRRLNSNDDVQPAKRRSLQSGIDTAIPIPGEDLSSQSENQRSVTTSSVTQNRFNDVTFVMDESKPSIEVSHSSTSKVRGFPSSEKNLSKSTAADSTDVRRKRVSLLKKLLTPVMRRSARKRRERRALAISLKEENTTFFKQESTETKLKKNLFQSGQTNPIYRSDSLTIIELSDSSLNEKMPEEKIVLPPPSPILAPHNVNREEDSFGACLENEPCVDVTSDSRLSSLDILQEANSVDFLDCSQKQDEYFESKLDAELESCLPNIVPPKRVSSSPPKIFTKASPIYKLEKENWPPNTQHLKLPFKKVFAKRDQTLFSYPCENIREECRSVVEGLVTKVSRETRAHVKPIPPIRSCSRNRVCIPPQCVIEDLHCEVVDVKCDLGEWRIPRSKKIVSPQTGFSTFLDKKSSNASSKSDCSQFSSRDQVTSIKRGKVLAAVQHFNELSSHVTSKKLSPLPYREGRERKGSFKMGKPSGGALKLDLPSHLELPSSSNFLKEKVLPPSNLNVPIVPTLDLTDDAVKFGKSRSQHRKSKSLDSLAVETSLFRHEPIPRSPSLSRLNRPPLAAFCCKSSEKCLARDFLDSNPTRRATSKLPRSRSPLLPMPPTTYL